MLFSACQKEEIDSIPEGAIKLTTEGFHGDVNEPSEWETKCTSAQWTALAAKGCVFLPAAGYSSGISHINDAGSWGRYWSSSSYTDNVEYASDVQFKEEGLGFIHWTRFTRQSVRLVQDAN